MNFELDFEGKKALEVDGEFKVTCPPPAVPA